MLRFILIDFVLNFERFIFELILKFCYRFFPLFFTWASVGKAEGRISCSPNGGEEAFLTEGVETGNENIIAIVL